MANLHETANWTDGIYRIELDDPVEGGESGVDNRPHKELANRTLYLKKALDTANLKIAGLESTLTTMNEKIAQLETLTGGSERLDGLVEIENRLTALELNAKKGGTFIELTIAGEGNSYTITTNDKQGDISADSTLSGGSPKSFTITLPADYDESTHRYKITAYARPMTYGLQRLSGTTNYTVASDDNKRLVIEVPTAQFTKDNQSMATSQYISMIMLIEVVER